MSGTTADDPANLKMATSVRDRIEAAYRELLDGTLPAASALICQMSAAD